MPATESGGGSGRLAAALRSLRLAAALASCLPVLPVGCGAPQGGIYTGGVQPSPGGRINPAEPGFANGGR